MEKELEKQMKGYKGPIVVYKLRQLASKDTKNASVYLSMACKYARETGLVGLYEEIYNITKKVATFSEVKLPPYDESKIWTGILAWSRAEQAKYKQEAQKKDGEIVKAVSNQMRDAIRVPSRNKS